MYYYFFGLLFRIITGAFDKTVKIWSVDGKLVHRLEGFLSTVTGVCYVPRNKTLWVASGHSNAQLYDPKSGDNVSNWVHSFHWCKVVNMTSFLLEICSSIIICIYQMIYHTDI